MSTEDLKGAAIQHSADLGQDSQREDSESQQPKECDEELKRQLADVQQDIQVLRSALADKIKKESELKSVLGLNIMHDIQEDINQTMRDIKRSSVYQRTSEGLRLASDKISPHIGVINESIRKQAATLKSNSIFKSFEEGMMNTWSSMKCRVMGNRPTYQGPSNDPGPSEGATMPMTERTAFQKSDKSVVHDGLLDNPRSSLTRQTDSRDESHKDDFRRMPDDQLLNIDMQRWTGNKKN